MPDLSTPQSESDATDSGGWLRPVTWIAALLGLALVARSDWIIVPPTLRHPIVFAGGRRWLVVGVATFLVAMSFVPLVSRVMTRAPDRLRRPSAGARGLTTLVVFAVATAYLLFTAKLQGRDFTMNIQDEMMYLVQARMLTRGRLWYPAHPLADFFQELLIVNRPVYASMYFPGTALLYAGGLLLSIPDWLLAALVAGGAVAMIYRVVAGVTDDGVIGLLVAFLFVGVSAFRWTSIMVMSHPLLLLQGMLMFWSVLRWRRARRPGWMLAFGFFAGWAAITRPLDALAFGVPLFAWIAVELFHRPLREKLVALALMALAAAPLLSIQLIFDKGVTGHWLRTPVQYFHDRYFPGDFRPRHTGDLPPNLDGAPSAFKYHYTDFLLKQEMKYREESLWLRWPVALKYGVPATWLLFFLPAGLVALIRRPRARPLAAVFLCFVIGYMTFPFFLPHYVMIVAPVVLMLVALGGRQLATAAGRFAPQAGAAVTLVLLATAVVCLPEIGGMNDEPRVSATMQAFNRQERRMTKPALVFFRSLPDNESAWRHEQVYNVEGAPIDASPVIRARDLGPRDIELVRYYADRQPNRTVFVFHQEAGQLQRIGTAAEIRDHPQLLDVPDVRPPEPPPAPARRKRGRTDPADD